VESVNWAVHVDVASGPKLSAADTITVEAYDKVSLTLDANASNVSVDLQPGTAGQIKLLLITASAYDADVTYSADAGTTKVPLDAPLVLVGGGAVGLLQADPTTLQWDNGTADPVAIQIFVGRDATP
jgi:hypothetical protein